MGKFNDLTGKTFHYLEVIEQLPDRIDKSGRRRKMWRCKCMNCGGEASVSGDALMTGKQMSCGCYKIQRSKETSMKHGMTDTRLYNVWNGIKSRCYNTNVYTYPLYGGRGITMCDEWRFNFKAFYDWAISNGYDTNAPRGKCTIDRINADGNYCPENCRIISQGEQCKNRRTNVYLEYGGLRLTVTDWARRTGISREKITNRIKRLGWTPERALTTK